jgi:hypothetical protein
MKVLSKQLTYHVEKSDTNQQRKKMKSKLDRTQHPTQSGSTRHNPAAPDTIQSRQQGIQKAPKRERTQ